MQILLKLSLKIFSNYFSQKNSGSKLKNEKEKKRKYFILISLKIKD